MEQGQKDRLIDGLYSLYINNLLVDLRISCDGEVIRCHKNVLAANSPYFRAMLTNDVAEAKDGQVTVTETTPHILRLVVEYCYHGNIPISNENVQDILTTANMFEMLPLRDLCAEYMIKELHQSNCVEMYQLADVYSCPKMKEDAWVFLLENFTAVCKTEQVSALSFEDMKRLLTCDDLYIDCEELVFEAMINWINANADERKSCTSRLFPCVRLGLLSAEYLANDVWNNPLIHANPLLRSQVAMAKLFTISQREGLNSEDGLCDDINANKRLGMFNTQMMIFSGGGLDQNSRSLTGFDPETGNNYFAIKPHVNFDNRFRIDLHQLVVAPGNQIYILGGIYYIDYHFEDEFESRALEEVRLFDHRKNCWITKPSMPEPRCAFSAVCAGNDIYITGGKSLYPAGDILDTVRVYSIADEKWSACPSMPFKLFHHRAVGGDGCLYVLGGFIEDMMVTDTILHFDITSQVWTVLTAHMKFPRAEFGAAVFNDRIWVVGGTDGTSNLSSTEMFVIDSGRWRGGPDFLEDRKSPTLLVLNDQLYVYGGIRTIHLSNVSRNSHRTARNMESKDLSRLDDSNQWHRVVKNVQYGNMYGCTVGQLNVKWLAESGYNSNVNIQ